MKNGKTSLYRHWDIEGNLLYVGISLSAVYRLSQHMSGAAWADQINKVTLETFPTRAKALAAERLAIRQERPKWNKAHNAANQNAPEARPKLDAALDVARDLYRRWSQDEGDIDGIEMDALLSIFPELAFFPRPAQPKMDKSA